MSIKWSKIAKNSNDVLIASKEGFDCIEMDIEYLINLSDEEFLFLKNLMHEKNIFCKTCNSILPLNVIVTEDGFNIYTWIDYLKKAASRASELGCEKFIWNDGKARLLPYEEDSGNAKEQVFQFLYMLCELLKHYEITLLIEPLGLAQANYINSIEEAQELVNIINKDNLSSLISINQLSQISFKENDFDKFKSIIKHIYFEDPITCSNYNYIEIFKNLDDITYNHLISLPNKANKNSLDYCKKLLNEV